ncbi:MAG: hypothetical protein R3B94_11170 [Hyphomonas sp.]
MDALRGELQPHIVLCGAHYNATHGSPQGAALDAPGCIAHQSGL